MIMIYLKDLISKTIPEDKLMIEDEPNVICCIDESGFLIEKRNLTNADSNYAKIINF